jgi:simple sugar transport system substrate-binding protein
MLMHLAGQLDQNEYQFPGVLITRDFLLENEIANMDDLRSKMPALSLTEVMAADWIPVVTF